MKSRLTTYLLLAAVAAIWGAIAWKLLSSRGHTVLPAESAVRSAMPGEPVDDTLVIDYPDPFLKGRHSETMPVTARVQPRPAVHAMRCESPVCEHAGTVSAGGRTIYIVMLDGEQYEAERGDSVAGFVLSGADGDSLYMVRDGVKYGVKLCD